MRQLDDPAAWLRGQQQHQLGAVPLLHRFSVPYLNPWGVAVMYTPSSAESAGSFFTAIFTLFIEPFFINFLCFIFIWICIFAHLIWYVEKTNNPTHFPPGCFDGIDDAIWWAAVTVTTVGYGDKGPNLAKRPNHIPHLDGLRLGDV